PFVEGLETRCLPSTITLNFNSLPSAQGWTYLSGFPPNSPLETNVYSFDGTKLTQNTMGIGDNFGNYVIYNGVDPTKPCTINVRRRVLQSELLDQGAAFAFDVVAFTGSEVFGFGLNTTTIRAPLGTQQLASIDATQFHDYRIEANPGVNVSIYVDNA